MGEIKWIKLATGLPDNRKIKQMRLLPNGDTIALMWVFLMCLAGETNDEGMIYFMPEIPYTDEMLAEQFSIDVNTVRLGLATFQRWGMIEIIDDIICLPAWEKWQAVDKLSEIREQTRKRVAKHRERQKLCASNVTGNVTVTQSNATDIETEEEPEEDNKNKDIKDIVAFLNEKAGTNYRPSTKSTRDKIQARLNEGFTLDDFKTVIEKKCAAWVDDPKMSKFLRPETLFGPKFEGYLNERTRKEGASYGTNNECSSRFVEGTGTWL